MSLADKQEILLHWRANAALTDKQEKLKKALIATGEDWSPTWENILKLDPDYFEAYVGLRSVPRNKKNLSVKIQELILLSLDAACTHLYDQGIRAHTAAALRAGATKEEIFEALELSSVLGVHAVTVGVPTLLEVLKENGREISSEMDERKEKLKQDFTTKRGYWSDIWDSVLRLSPEFFEGYTAFSSVPFKGDHSHLDAKTKELIYVAIDCSTTHLFQSGLKVHIQNAVKYGASEHEIMEVFELAALMGIQTTMKGADVLVEEVAKEEERKEEAKHNNW